MKKCKQQHFFLISLLVEYLRKTKKVYCLKRKVFVASFRSYRAQLSIKDHTVQRNIFTNTTNDDDDKINLFSAIKKMRKKTLQKISTIHTNKEGQIENNLHRTLKTSLVAISFFSQL